MPGRLSRRDLCKRALSLAGVSLIPGSLTGAQSRPPNIVWMMLDDLGYGDPGCYGQKQILTPNIDRLATQGTRFTDCYAGGAVCAPSRSVLMTGLHMGHTSVRTNAGTVPLRNEDVTVAQLLKKAGYTNGLFGKWGLGDAGSDAVPTKKGFDEFFGYMHQIHAHDYYTDFLWHNETKHMLPGNANGKRGQYSADVIADKTLDFIRRNQGKPFFLYFTPTLPHSNYEVPDTAPYTERDWPATEKIYAAMVTRADDQIGRILDLLHELKLDDNTVVFFTSDNGAASAENHSADFFKSNGPLRGVKAQMYEGGIRVPMIARWPGHIPVGAVNHVPWSFCDFLPTALDLAGVRAPKALDGMSMVPILNGKSADPGPRLLYWEQYQFDRKANDVRRDTYMQAGRKGDWKAISKRPGAALELYNLRSDLSEKTDVAAANPAVVAEFQTALKAAHAEPRPHNTGNFEFVH
ncbi:MAG: arylsulfatase [Acidobacteriota bacterium]|nr:arylsulfatase [Acidobacteriota bacterium]